MANTLETLRTLSAAEEFFEHLGVPYDPAVIRVNRLHVLKRFNQYLRGSQPDVAGLEAGTQLQICRELLIRAYQDFVRSTPAQEKVFKVFQDAEGSQIGLDTLRRTLPSRNSP